MYMHMYIHIHIQCGAAQSEVWRRNAILAHGCSVILPQQMCMPADVRSSAVG